jgi:UPF0755 protein
VKRLLVPILVLLLLVAGVASGAFVWGYGQYRAFLDTPVAPQGGAAVVTVAPGTNLRALGRQLEAAGLIEDVKLPGVGSVFYLWAHKVEEAGPRIRAGEYLFEGPNTPGEILDVIISGRVRTFRVTIPEGLRLDEIMPLFEEAGLADAEELLALAFDADLVRALGIDADSLEGYVFPTTYHFPRGFSARRILERTVAEFETAWAAAEAERRDGIALDKHEAVTLASIIEKETGQVHERPTISCVFHNRLREDWKLQTDPTVIYAKILRTGGWDGRITYADLREPHPYNTYTERGLPPGPIASPGAAALKAALNPPDCPYFFFVSKNDGSHEFCPDYACHTRAVRRWQNPRYGMDR